MENAMANARLLSKALESSGWYRCVSDIHRPKGQLEYKKGESYEGKDDETSADYNAGLPVVAFTLSDDFKQKYPHVKQVSISNLLRAKQYIIPSRFRTSQTSKPRKKPHHIDQTTNHKTQTTPSLPRRTPPRSCASSSARPCPWTCSTA